MEVRTTPEMEEERIGMLKMRRAVFYTALSICLGLGIAGCNANPPATTTANSVSAPAPEPQKTIAGPVPGTRLTEGYVAQVARSAYFWAWPMANIYNRVQTFEKLPGPALLGGIVPAAPANQFAMLTDYIKPEERIVACPNQDVVYGNGPLDLGQEPAVVQVPDFGDRFWVYQIVDQRTDSFAEVGKMYSNKPGFYLLVGPGWNGKVPDGIAGVFHSPTNYGIVIPRVFKQSTPEDTAAVQPVLNQIVMYPLSKFDGKMKTVDWSKTPSFTPPGKVSSSGDEETKWVIPEKFYDQFSKILDGLPPLPGEEPMYATFRSVWAAADQDPKLKQAAQKAILEADKELVAPVFQFRNYGIPLPGNWTTQTNGAKFGTDYYTRTAVAKSNIFVNSPNETKYFYQDLDSNGGRLNGAHSYTVTFPAGQLPPVKGFWSLTMYNEHHFFEPNKLVRYSLGTKNKDLQTSPDGSLTIYVSSTPPSQDKMTNWLPSPKGDFSLYVRSYWPEPAILEGKWTPPAVVKAK
jgi:hypothetical protein